MCNGDFACSSDSHSQHSRSYYRCKNGHRHRYVHKLVIVFSCFNFLVSEDVFDLLNSTILLLLPAPPTLVKIWKGVATIVVVILAPYLMSLRPLTFDIIPAVTTVVMNIIFIQVRHLVGRDRPTNAENHHCMNLTEGASGVITTAVLLGPIPTQTPVPRPPLLAASTCRSVAIQRRWRIHRIW